MAVTASKVRTVRDRSTSRWRTENGVAGAAAVPVAPRHLSGTTAKIPSSSVRTPSSRASRSSSNQRAGATSRPRARAHMRQVCTQAPRSMETAWKEKLLYLKEFCQYLIDRTRYWSVASAPSGAPGPAASRAARTSPVASPVSRRRMAWWRVA